MLTVSETFAGRKKESIAPVRRWRNDPESLLN
jgi:hypothetical protein